MLSDIITVDLVEHLTSVIDDFCVVSRVPVIVPVRLLVYLTWGDAFYHIIEAGGRRPPASHATLTTGDNVLLIGSGVCKLSAQHERRVSPAALWSH